MSAKTPLERACDCVGSAAKLAGLIGVSQQTLSNWKERGVPIERCLAIERATDSEVTRKDLRPDDFELIWPDLSEPAAPSTPSRRSTDKQAT